MVVYWLFLFRSTTTPSLLGRWAVDTDERTTSNVFSGAGVIQGRLSCSVTAENQDTELATGLEDAGVINNETFVKTGEENPQEEEKVSFLPDAKV